MILRQYPDQRKSQHPTITNWVLPLECIPQPSGTKKRPAPIITMYRRYTVPTDINNIGVGVHHQCARYSRVMVMMDAVCLIFPKKHS